MGSFLQPQMFRRDESRQLTKDSPGRDRLSVEPERYLGEDDSHDAGKVRLDHKVTDFPLQVEVGCHHDVLSCSQMKNEAVESHSLFLFKLYPLSVHCTFYETNKSVFICFDLHFYAS